MSVQILPIFKGYTIDVRLRQFRKVTRGKVQFIDFNSVKGEKILLEYIKALDPKSKEFKDFIHNIKF